MEYFWNLLLIFCVAVAALLLRKLLQMLEKSLNIEMSDHTEAVIDRAVEEAVRAVEEEARVAPANLNLKGKAKKNLAVDLAGKMLATRGISITPDILVGKIVSKVHKLFR